MRLVLAAVLCCAGCERIIGISDLSSSDGAAARDGSELDASPPPSCVNLAAGCTGVSCCDSRAVPGGTFYRGHDAAADNMFPDRSRPATVSTFRLDRFEVTVGRFRQFIEAGFGTQANPPAAGAGGRQLNGASDQAGWEATWNASLAANAATLSTLLQCPSTEPQNVTWTGAPSSGENRPINCVTWYEAFAFCIWDGGYLPTEAEWHYATSGGDQQRAYAWSNPPSLTLIDCTLANYGGTAWPSTACVPSGPNNVGANSPAGDGRWGHADLSGGVWEWVLDRMNDPPDPYAVPCNDCADVPPGNANKGVRGGAFYSPATDLRVPQRNGSLSAPRDSRSWAFGFRCARPAP